MFLTDVWINPIIFQMSDEQMVRRIQLINEMFHPYGIDLIQEDMIQLMRECRNVQYEK